MRNKVNALMAGAKRKAMEVINRTDAGVQTLMVCALLCVIAVALTAAFRTEAGTLIGSIFDTMTTDINSTLFKEFGV